MDVNVLTDKPELFSQYPDVLTVPMLCEMLGGINPNLAYKLLSDGTIKNFRIGRLRRILKQLVIDFLFDDSARYPDDVVVS